MSTDRNSWGLLTRDWTTATRIVELACARRTDELRDMLADLVRGYRYLNSYAKPVQDIAAARVEIAEREKELYGTDTSIDDYYQFVLMAACPLRGDLVVEDGWGSCEGCGATVVNDAGDVDGQHG